MQFAKTYFNLCREDFHIKIMFQENISSRTHLAHATETGGFVLVN